jgi:hypothetical protein
MHGEWVSYSPELVEAFDCIAPGVDVTQEFGGAHRLKTPGGYVSLDHADLMLDAARVEDRLGWRALEKVIDGVGANILRRKVTFNEMTASERQRIKAAATSSPTPTEARA